MNIWKKSLPDLLAIVLFAAIAFAYFFPSNIDGRILFREDHAAGRGAGQEATEYYQRTGERTRWTNALFSGMPTYQTSPSYDSTKPMSFAAKVYRLFLPGETGYVFLYLLGFYILLRAFDFRQSLAALGSVIWAFSSYFLIIITAGHIWKVMALAYLPPMLAGIVLAYRGKYLWGLVVLALFTALEINANHVQMTYYYLFIILFMVIGYLVEAIMKKRIAHFIKASAVCVVAAAIGISLNLSNLYHTWEYSKETMRGKSELVKANTSNQTDSGLERSYITQWSYGIDETWSLLIPNVKGGASVPLSKNKVAMEHADNQYVGIYQQLGQYWGEQPGTSGPVYVGAFVLTLFVLGLFIVKGPIKWALLAATILSVLLSWGHNFMGFTDFFIDHVPMYAKFRTVSSILVIAEFTIPLLAMLALKRVVDEPGLLAKKKRYLYASIALTGGFCLLFAVMPGVFFPDYVSSSEMQALSQIPSEQLSPLLANLTEMRRAMFTADCWRSFVVVVLGSACLLLFKMKKMNAKVMVGAIFAICLVDMWQIDKRYLNDEMFVNKSVRDKPIEPDATERMILQDKSDCQDWRVLNMSTNTFNENETSYFLKSIGGYHAAKLRRYQELIEAHIQPEMQKAFSAVAQAQGDLTQVNGDSIYPVLNMLNAKYFILPLQGGQTVPVQNPYTYGNAWFVDKVDYVDNANKELDYLSTHDLRHEAVADKKFQSTLGEAATQDSTSTVAITSYEANKLTYKVNSTKGGVIVFSEIYYPGWKATVDGQEVPVSRVNYVLRAINVKPGQHDVELSFFPKSVTTTDRIAYAGYGVLLMVLLLIAFLGWKKRKAT